MTPVDIYFSIKALGALLKAAFCGIGILIAGAVAVASVMRQ